MFSTFNALTIQFTVTPVHCVGCDVLADLTLEARTAFYSRILSGFVVPRPIKQAQVLAEGNARAVLTICYETNLFLLGNII